MEDTARELAVQALKDSLIAISYYANRRPKCTEEFRTNSEHIRSLSQAVADVWPIATSASIDDVSSINCGNKSKNIKEVAEELEHYRNAKFVTFDDLSEIFDFKKNDAPSD